MLFQWEKCKHYTQVNMVQDNKHQIVVNLCISPNLICMFHFVNVSMCDHYLGTGKTLVARALANECSQGDKKVAFFMRKGADCLSKWVGESERQLRLLFDQVRLLL